MSFGYGLAGEEIIHMRHRTHFVWRAKSRAKSLTGGCYSVPKRGQDVGSVGADLGKRPVCCVYRG
jgi:hypothetical protein